MLTFSSALSAHHLLFCCPSCFLALSVLLTLSPCASLLSYFITLTPAPTTLLHMPLNWSPIILWLLFAPSIIAVTLPFLTLLPRLPLIGNLASRGPATVGVMSYSKSIHLLCRQAGGSVRTAAPRATNDITSQSFCLCDSYSLAVSVAKRYWCLIGL